MLFTDGAPLDPVVRKLGVPEHEIAHDFDHMPRRACLLAWRRRK